MTEPIDIRRPDGVVLTCPVCGLRRDMPANWRDIMGVPEVKCREDNVVMVETAQ